MKLRLGIVAVVLGVGIALATLLSMGHGTASHSRVPTAQSGNVAAGRYGSRAPLPTTAKPIPSTPKMAKTPAMRQPAAVSPPTTLKASPAPTNTNPIPQGNGGDQDPDNNGAASDGDGNL